jgi:hypothetical protein
VSPQNVVDPLAPGEHVFAARAVDFAGNVGKAVHEWTIEAGDGPAAVILDGPDELTNQTEATFTIEAPGATRLECSLNDGDAEACRTRAVFEVDEGENTVVVRGFAGDTPGAPATYRWTVDTTPPEVKIDAVTFTNGLAVEVAFTTDESAVRVECALLERTVPAEGEPEPEPELLGMQENCTDPAACTDLAPGDAVPRPRDRDGRRRQRREPGRGGLRHRCGCRVRTQRPDSTVLTLDDVLAGVERNVAEVGPSLQHDVSYATA